MATIAKTVVGTGLSSGLGIEAAKQLLEQAQPYRLIMGARDLPATQAAVDGFAFDRAANPVSLLPLDLSDLRGVRAFARSTLDQLGPQGRIDYLFLNAGMLGSAEKAGPHGTKWCESYVVNHLSQHYLIHLLREKLEASKARIVVVSSGAVRGVPDASVLDKDVVGGAGTAERTIYSETKFIQLLGAHWWRRQLAGKCDVVAVSPGLIPNTGLGRNSSFKMSTDMPDAKTIPEGAASMLKAFTKSDFPEDPDQIFLTSWGEWWPSSVYEKSLDKALQDKWSPSKEEIEKEEGIAE